MNDDLETEKLRLLHAINSNLKFILIWIAFGLLLYVIANAHHISAIVTKALS